MRKQLVGAVVALVTLLGVGLPASAGAPAGSESSWIVALVDGSDPSAEAPGLARSHGGRSGHIYEYALSGFQFFGSEQAASNLARNPRVRSVIPDGVVQAVVETVPTGVSRIEAPAAHATATGSGAVVAVIDTGIDLDHPDLEANIHPTLGKNCTNKRRSPNDDNGHGTHVAGTIAAIRNNHLGVIGVAPGAKLVPVKVLNSAGSGTWADVICGIDYVTENATVIRVANMSLGGSGSVDERGCEDGGMHKAICTAVGAGVTFVVAAGNDAKDASTFVPAAYPEALTVSAFGGGNEFAYFSNYGSIVDVMAPGVDIYSTVIGGYGTKSGTSMAAPHVAGVAALAIAAGTATTPAQVEALLKRTGECPNGTTSGDDGSCAGQGAWSGDRDSTPEPLVNAARAVAGSTGGGGGTPPDETTITLSARGYKVKGVQHADLTWSPSGSVDIYRNGSSITTSGGSTYTDNIGSKGGGTHVYEVCDAGTGTCSNEVTVVF